MNRDSLATPHDQAHDQSCDTCLFWWHERSRRTVAGWGQCRRMPPSLPTARAEKLKLVGIWPETEADDWCGEWRARPDGESEP